MHNKHQIIEERYEGKLSRTVLKTNGIGDSPVEFNTLATRFRIWETKTKKRNGTALAFGVATV